MENNLVLKEKFDILTPEEIDLLIKFDEIEKRVKVIKDQKDEMLKQYFRENKTKEIETNRIEIKYKESYIRHDVDKQKMKDEGIYELYLKETPVSDSVTIKVKYDD